MSKITQLPEDTTPTGDDMMEIAHDPAGTPISRKVKILNLLKRLFLADNTQLTWGAVVDGEFLKRDGTTITSDVVASGPATQIQETSGPTVLDVAAIADGEFLKRVGTEIVSADPGGGGSYAGVTTGGTGSLDFAQGTKTTSEPFIDATVTWNSSAVIFDGIKIDVTDTASNGTSKILDLQAGGISRLRVHRPSSWQVLVADGTGSVPGIGGVGDPDTGITWNESANTISFVVGGGVTARINSDGIHTGGTEGFRNNNGAATFRWQSGTRIIQTANAVIRIDGNSNETANAGIILGGTTASFPRLRANGPRLEARLANDSAYTQFTCEKLGVNNSAAASTPGTVTKKIEVFDAAGNSLGFIAVYDSIT